jgi:hypothetical protein
MKLAELYERDETAWLEKMSLLIADQRWRELDYGNLVDFLQSMANREKRKVDSRMRQLLLHLLKWHFQPDKRTRSWRRTIEQQREALGELFESKALRNTAEEKLADCYKQAVKGAAAETGLDASDFPKSCPYSIDFVLGEELPGQESNAG